MMFDDAVTKVQFLLSKCGGGFPTVSFCLESPQFQKDFISSLTSGLGMEKSHEKLNKIPKRMNVINLLIEKSLFRCCFFLSLSDFIFEKGKSEFFLYMHFTIFSLLFSISFIF